MTSLEWTCQIAASNRPVDVFDFFIRQPFVNIAPIWKRLRGPGILCRRRHGVEVENLQNEPLIPAQAVAKKQFRSGPLIGL